MARGAAPRYCKDCSVEIGPRQHRCSTCREDRERQQKRNRKRVAREIARAARRCPSCGGPIEKFKHRCAECIREAKKERHRRYYQDNRERLDERGNAWARANYDPKKARDKNKRYRSQPGVPERLSRQSRAAFIRRQYRITPEEYVKLTSGACAICGKEGKLVLDHCHVTRLARGGLCSSCNTGLGYFRDDPELLHNAATYLMQSKAFLARPALLVLQDYLAANRRD